MPVWIVPGHADGAVTLHVGYGRERAGRVGDDAGVDVWPIVFTDSPWRAPQACVSPRTFPRRALPKALEANMIFGV